MPRPPNKRKEHLAGVQDAIAKRQKTSKRLEERLEAPKEDSSPIDAIVVPDAISSLHTKKRTPEAEAGTNTALPDVATSLSPPIARSIAVVAINTAVTALPDVATSLPSTDVDADDDANAHANTVTDTQSNNHLGAADPSTSTSMQGVKLEATVKTETASETASTSTSTNQTEAPIPMEPVMNGPNLNLTVAVRRKAARRTNPLYVAPPPQTIAAPLSWSPQAEKIPATKKPRVEEPLLTATDEAAARKIASPDISEALPSPDTPPRSTATVNVSTRRRSQRQIQLQLIETRETQPDDTDDNDADYVDDNGDLSGPAPTSTVNALTRRRSSRHVIPTSSTGTPVSPPTATMEASSRRQSRRQTQFSRSEMSEVELDDDADHGDLPGSIWEDRLRELGEYRKIHGHCKVSKSCSENTKLGNWVSKQRKKYKLHLQGEQSSMTLSRIQTLESFGFEWDSLSAAWADRLSELADYRKIHGHCNVPKGYSENTKLGNWVSKQRMNYTLHLQGNPSSMTLSRIQALEILGFEWHNRDTIWEGCLNELAEYRKIHGHCNVPKHYSENTKLGMWVSKQKAQCKRYREGKTSPMTPFRFQALESLDFESDCYGAAWADRLSELADYRKIHGHCNVPKGYSENTKLGTWVSKQKVQCKRYREGKTSPMTPFRFQALESLDLECDYYGAAWADRLSELAEYRKIHGHCNVPKGYSENTKLGTWVSKQRKKYKLHLQGKQSSMTLSRIQTLESFGFEWDSLGAAWADRLSELAEYRKIHGHCNVPKGYSENTKLGNWVSKQKVQYRGYREGKTSPMTPFRFKALESLGFE
jgi:predicted chitinase